VDGNLTITATGAPATLVGFTGGVSALAGTPTNSVIFLAKDPGTYGNTIDVEVVSPSSVFDAPADHYDVIISGQVDDDGVVQVLERFNNMSNDSADGVRFIENALMDGLNGENAPSEVLRATALATHAPYPGKVDLGATGTNVAAFTVGNDGIAGLVAADYIGTTSGATSTGLKALRDSELVRFNIVMVPGVSHKDVITEMESLVDFRKDAIALIDPPIGLLRDDVIAWHNGTNIAVANSPVAPLSETYSAMAWPWYKRFSSFLSKSVFLPPSVGVVQTFAAVDRAAGPFIASAGFTHGLIQGSELEFNPRQEDRDALLGGTNRVNPLFQSAQFGLTFYGNRTLQRAAGPLDSIHVVRMLIFVKRSAVDAIQTLQFQPNDPQTWRDFEQRLEPILRSVQAARGLESFSIKVDEDTNPASLRAQKTMRGIITLRHIDAAEIIELDFALATTGSEFSV
jgi:phage tail sheath protein FI